MDEFKAIYKILNELKRNMGNEKFEIYNISADALKIPFDKWEQLLILMQDNGYIKGIVTSKDVSQRYRHIIEPINPEITLKGLEYLANNSYMAKAKEILKTLGEIM